MMKGPVRFIHFAIDNHYGECLHLLHVSTVHVYIVGYSGTYILKHAFKNLSPILLIYSRLLFVINF